MTDGFDQALSQRIKSALDVQHHPDWPDVVSRSAPREPARRSRQPRRRLAFVVGLASCLLILSLGLALRGGGATGVGTAQAGCTASGASAAGCLRALAGVAERSSHPHAIVYQRVLNIRVIWVVPQGATVASWAVPLATAKRPFMVNEVQTTETWIQRSTGQGVQKADTNRLEFPTARDRAAWEAAGSPSLKRLGANPGPASVKRFASDASNRFLYHPAAWIKVTQVPDPEPELPFSVDAMVSLLQSVASTDGNGSNWPAYASLPLTDPSLLPAQRAALLGAVARAAPYAKLLGRMRDPLGRNGVAISNLYDQAKGPGSIKWVYLYDTRTSKLLAEGAWPGGVSPRQAGWRSSLAYRVFAVSGGAAQRVPNS